MLFSTSGNWAEGEDEMISYANRTGNRFTVSSQTQKNTRIVLVTCKGWKCNEKSDLRMKRDGWDLLISFRISPVRIYVSLDPHCGQHDRKDTKLTHLKSEGMRRGTDKGTNDIPHGFGEVLGIR